MSTDKLEGLVLAHLGQGIAVEHEGDIILCQPLRKLDTVTVGDRVMWSLVAPEQGRIESILPRRSLLTRPSRNDKIRPVAANIDTVYVVFAVEPYCDFLLLDQYLAICENRNFNAALILNKTDLTPEEKVEYEDRFSNAFEEEQPWQKANDTLSSVLNKVQEEKLSRDDKQDLRNKFRVAMGRQPK